MSRQLAITVGESFPRGGSAFRNPADRTPTIFIINTETGKGIALDLGAQSQRVWYPLPKAPLFMLGPIDCDKCAGGDAHADNCPEMLKLEAKSFTDWRGAPIAKPSSDDDIPFPEARNLKSDIAEDR